ncbi:hypothetical protein JCM24511_08407, partial [Saitozyma sp. JCM 24511]
MSLRSTILTHSLPLLPTYSFTRQTLTHALSSLPSDHPSYRPEPLSESVVDTLFGPGPSAGKALVEAWEHEGLSRMDKGKGVQDMLERRLSYSAEVGEHLVEAYALLSSPESTASIPLPTIPVPIKQLLNFRLPPLYTPPGTVSSSSSSAPRHSTSEVMASLSDATGGRLPFLRFSPLGPLSYAWRIADEAMALQDKSKPLKKGVMDEPVGAGPEWYASRIGLSLAYLAAESHLLRPFPSPSSELSVSASDSASPANPHLPAAIVALRRNLKWCDDAARSVQGAEQGAGDLMGFAEF